MAHGKVVTGGLLVGSAGEENQLVPLADDRPVCGAARWTSRQTAIHRAGVQRNSSGCNRRLIQIGRRVSAGLTFDANRNPVARFTLWTAIDTFGKASELQGGIGAAGRGLRRATKPSRRQGGNALILTLRVCWTAFSTVRTARSRSRSSPESRSGMPRSARSDEDRRPRGTGHSTLQPATFADLGSRRRVRRPVTAAGL